MGYRAAERVEQHCRTKELRYEGMTWIRVRSDFYTCIDMYSVSCKRPS